MTDKHFSFFLVFLNFVHNNLAKLYLKPLSTSISLPTWKWVYFIKINTLFRSQKKIFKKIRYSLRWKSKSVMWRIYASYSPRKHVNAVPSPQLTPCRSASRFFSGDNCTTHSGAPSRTKINHNRFDGNRPPRPSVVVRGGTGMGTGGVRTR